MSRRLRRPVLASLLMAATASAAVLPPSHIHLAAEHDHDHAAVEHSHWAAHHHGGAQFDDDDGRVLFVDRPAVPGSAHERIERPIPALVTVLLAASPLAFSRQAHRISGNAPRDGPSSGSSGLRAPPISPAV